MSREKLPMTRRGKTHRGTIFNEGTGDAVKLHITVNTYADGRPAELFVSSDQHGGTLDGMLDAWSTAVSLYWQMGGDVGTFVRHFSYQNFSPLGWTDNPAIHVARSVVDYIARWVGMEYGEKAKTVLDQSEEKG